MTVVPQLLCIVVQIVQVRESAQWVKSAVFVFVVSGLR